MKLKLAFSTCPNDTFMFDALVHQRIDTGGLAFDLTLADIFHLNQLAEAGEPDLVKISYNTYGRVLDQYQLLDAGSALGHDCGPLLIARKPIRASQIANEGLKVAIPGKNTTAHLLLGYFAPEIRQKEEMIFHEIMPALVEGKVDAGVIIHENRFTYQQHGLHLVQDLGSYWEQQTGLPIPLGAIVAHKRLGEARIRELETMMRESVAYAFAHPEASRPFVRAHAQEMEEAVMRAHINLYVNDYSLSLGRQGREAVRQLLAVGESMQQYPAGTAARL